MLLENESVIAVRFGELWLRGRNRGHYIKKLLGNISERLSGEDVSIIREYDRVLIRTGSSADTESIKHKLSTIFGISRFEMAQTAKPDLASIKKLGSSIIASFEKGAIVRIQSHRSYKQHAFDSMDVLRELAKAAKKKGIIVSNRGFTREINVNVTKDCAFINTGSIKGAGGLPVGSGGKAVVLLSGGIDSPAAAWYAMKRGMHPIYVHMHGYPSNDAQEIAKITRLAEKLREYSLHYRIYLYYLFLVKSR